MKTTITPEQAKKMLLLNTKNRKMSRALVKTYADDMRAGRWLYNGDPIRVSATSVLLDGQHRLKACVDSEVPMTCELIEGLPDAVGATLDTGRRRSAADVLNMRGDGGSMNATGLAAACRQVLNYVHGVSAYTKQSTPAIMAMLDAYPDIEDWVRTARYGENIVPQSALASVLFLGTRAVGMDKRALKFAEGIHSGVALAEGDASLACRNFFIRARMRNVGTKSMSAPFQLSAVAVCWNAFATNRQMLLCRPTTDKDGRFYTPSIVGGPAPGGGVESLANVKIHGNQRKAIEGDYLASANK